MTESELDIIRIKLKLEVHQVLLRGLYTGLANSSPTGVKAYRDQFAALRKEHSKIAIPEFGAAYSDLIAAEYQEALEDALSEIESGFKAS